MPNRTQAVRDEPPRICGRDWWKACKRVFGPLRNLFKKREEIFRGNGTNFALFGMHEGKLLPGNAGLLPVLLVGQSLRIGG